MHEHNTKPNCTACSSIADWFALNGTELTLLALVTVGVIGGGMSM